MSEKCIAIGSDHAAYPLKEKLKAFLDARGFLVQDFGVHDETSMDYPDVARPLAEAVAAGTPVKRGILACGTGLGMSYAANRIRGVRAALCWSREAARLAREHNDANILVLPGRAATIDPPEQILAVWLETPFSEEARHARRIAKIEPEP